MRFFQRSLLLLAFAFLVFVPRNIFSCGPFFDSATFSFDTHPDYPIAAFLHGHLGVLQPSFHRMYLVIAYRSLNGHPLSSKEIDALDPLLTTGAKSADAMASEGFLNSYQGAPSSTPPSALWLTERAKVLGETPPQPDAAIDQNLNYANYQSFLNCPDASFTTAVATLRDRQQKWGAGSADLKTWIAGQDAVFARCSKKDAPLPPTIETTNPVLQRDRDYQVAAALLYSGSPDQLIEAVQRFDDIGHDKLSPWRIWGPYLAARSLIRAATLKSSQERAFDAELMTKAEARLKAILNNRMLIPSYPPCEHMLGFVEARLHPEERTRELAQRLTNGTSADVAQDLIDYRYLLDNNSGNDVNSEARKDDLTDWIRTFQSGPSAKDHAIEKWRETKSLPWLVAALTATPAKDPAELEFMAAASQLDPHDPRLLTVLFQRTASLHASGDDNAARSLIDANLAYLSKDAPISSRNLFWKQRMAMAHTFDEFLRFAPREDAAGPYAQLQLKEGAPVPPHAPHDTYFDTDSTAVFNRALPLSLLVRAAARVEPKPLQAEVAQSTWTRALLLNQPATASQLAPAVKHDTPPLAPSGDDYAKAATSEARHRAALWTLLHNPGLRPYVVPNMQRTTAVDRIDNYRDNWWCADLGARIDTASSQFINSAGVPVQPKRPAERSPAFLTPAEKSAADAEWSTLSKLGPAPNYLAAEVLAWAKSAPDDPRIPEALHLVVRATRYGCTDDKTGALSKQAFQLLHGKYSASDWARKTPYFY